MTQYILFVHGNEKSKSTPAQWEDFFNTAGRSGMFEGGSAIGERVVLGDPRPAKTSEHIVGYMRFGSNDKQKLLDLLNQHPVVVHGGTVELCEMPET